MGLRRIGAGRVACQVGMGVLLRRSPETSIAAEVAVMGITAIIHLEVVGFGEERLRVEAAIATVRLWFLRRVQVYEAVRRLVRLWVQD